MPRDAVYVGRGSIFGNPFTIADAGDYLALEGRANPETPRQLAVRWFREWLDGGLAFDIGRIPPSRDKIGALRGKNLACWCKLDRECHADILLELANS